MKNIYKPRVFNPVYGLRRPKFLSPTSLMQYYKEPDQFFLQRLCEVPPPRTPQTIPMGVGSAFDAYVKSDLHTTFIGPTAGTEYDLATMLNTQIEASHSPVNRAFLETAGRYAFNCYKRSGALASLAQDMGQAVMGSIKMEKTITAEIRGVPLLGKPDLCFQTTCPSDGGANLATFILDWKVNGFMSKNTTSPKRGYSCLRDGWDCTGGISHSKNHNKAHKDYMHHNVCGIAVNGMIRLEDVSDDWAIQTCTYAWALGAPIGSDIYCGIDQLACKQLIPMEESEIIERNMMPEIRIASFRMGIGQTFQAGLIEKYVRLWSLMSMSDESLMSSFFVGPDCDSSASIQRCQMLMNIASDGDELSWLDSYLNKW